MTTPCGSSMPNPTTRPDGTRLLERLRDLSKYGGSLPADDPQVQRWDRVERPDRAHQRSGPSVCTSTMFANGQRSQTRPPTTKALRAFITLHAEDWISFLLRLGANRGAVLTKARP